MEKKYFIVNESGEIVNVTKAEYEQYVEEHPKFGEKPNAPIFQTPESEENRKKAIDGVIESLNLEELTPEEKAEVLKGVKTQDDIERENRERLDDDLQGGKTASQQESMYGKEARVEYIIKMLNNLNLSEDEMKRLENEVETSKEEPENKEKDDKKEKEEDEQKQ